MYSVYVLMGFIGFLGGLHCLGMCGPLVLMYGSMRSGENNPNPGPGPADLWFNLGRTLSYGVLGFLAGLLGWLTTQPSHWFQSTDLIRGVLALGVGSIIFVVGTEYLTRGTSVWEHLVGGTNLINHAGNMIQNQASWVQPPRVALLGSLHGLLPCPILYPAYLFWALRASPVEGFVGMSLLGLGTIPSLLLVPYLREILGTSRGSVRLIGGLFVLLSLVPLTMGVQTLGLIDHSPLSGLLPYFQPL